MKKTIITLCVMALLGASACNNSGTDKKADGKDTTAAAAKDHTETEAPATPPDSATMAKAWEENMAITDMHKMMASWNGEWKAEMTMWMAPDAPPSKSTGTATYKMIYNGHYQEGKFKSDFQGMPFEGTSTLAFDNLKKKFVTTWIDNMGSGIMYMEGPWDEATKSMTLTGTGMDPVTKKECKMRQVMKVVDENKQVMEMYSDQRGGKEQKDMEIVYTRKK